MSVAGEARSGVRDGESYSLSTLAVKSTSAKVILARQKHWLVSKLVKLKRGRRPINHLSTTIRQICEYEKQSGILVIFLTL